MALLAHGTGHDSTWGARCLPPPTNLGGCRGSKWGWEAPRGPFHKLGALPCLTQGAEKAAASLLGGSSWVAAPLQAPSWPSGGLWAPRGGTGSYWGSHTQEIWRSCPTWRGQEPRRAHFSPVEEVSPSPLQPRAAQILLPPPRRTQGWEGKGGRQQDSSLEALRGPPQHQKKIK